MRTAATRRATGNRDSPPPFAAAWLHLQSLELQLVVTMTPFDDFSATVLNGISGDKTHGLMSHLISGG
jgi:hypothetical protein